MRLLSIACVLIAAATTPCASHDVATRCPVHDGRVNLRIDTGGHVYWNDIEIVDRAALQECLTVAKHMAPQPQFHLAPGPSATYDDIARVLTEAQRIGVTKIGFVGNLQDGEQ